VNLIKTFFSCAFLAPVALTTLLSSYSDPAEATAAFARATGSKCDKCHSVAFPRLTARGERFMRNGFQIKKKNDGGFGLDDDTNVEKDKLLHKIGEIISVTGNFDLATLKDGVTTPKLATPNAVGILATSTLAENTPIWAAVDFSGEGAEIHRYLIGRTNVFDSTWVNFRAGTLDPTTWTSFYGHSGAIDSASSDIGAYGGGHHGSGANFSQIGPGYAQRNAMEYYGYNDMLLWSVGIGNGDDGSDSHDASNNYDKGDYWAIARFDFWKGSSASLLWYNANGAVEKQAATAAINLRYKALDFRSQFTMDTSQYDTDKYKQYGATFQFDYKMADSAMFMYRYDTTDNGESGGIESQMTLALVMKPQQNIRITAAYVYEQDASGTATASDGHDHVHKISTRADGDSATSVGFGNRATINLHYMF
jgi:hypothetical protein